MHKNIFEWTTLICYHISRQLNIWNILCLNANFWQIPWIYNTISCKINYILQSFLKHVFSQTFDRFRNVSAAIIYTQSKNSKNPSRNPSTSLTWNNFILTLNVNRKRNVWEFTNDIWKYILISWWHLIGSNFGQFLTRKKEKLKLCAL